MKLPYLTLIREYLKEAIESGKRKYESVNCGFLLSCSFLGFYSKSITREEKQIYILIMHMSTASLSHVAIP